MEMEMERGKYLAGFPQWSLWYKPWHTLMSLRVPPVGGLTSQSVMIRYEVRSHRLPRFSEKEGLSTRARPF